MLTMLQRFRRVYGLRAGGCYKSFWHRKSPIYESDWHMLGTKRTLQAELSASTGISKETLLGVDLGMIPVSQKLFWAAQRVTTTPEDIVYCLLGLLAVNLPRLYERDLERLFIDYSKHCCKLQMMKHYFA